MKTVKRTSFLTVAILFILISIILSIATNFIADSLYGKYTLTLYVMIISFTVIGLGIIVVQFLGDWLARRDTASIILEAGDRKIVAQNLTSKDAEKLVELLQSLQEGHFSFENEEVSHEKNKDARSEKSVSSDTVPDKTFKEEAGVEQLVYIITFDNVSPVEADYYAEELREVLLDNLPMSRIQHGHSDRYSQHLGNTLILVLKAPEVAAATATIRNWLQLRKKVSLTIEAPGRKANIHNIDAATVARLNEIFLSQ